MELINSTKGGLNSTQSDVSQDPKTSAASLPEDTAPYPTAAPIMRRSERPYLNKYEGYFLLTGAQRRANEAGASRA